VTSSAVAAPAATVMLTCVPVVEVLGSLAFSATDSFV
jgi:hypothetical protein